MSCDQLRVSEGMSENAILIVPGIGGHPVFHAKLIEGVASRLPTVKVQSFPHGDFFGPAFNSLDQHAAYWADCALRFDNEMSGRRKTLLGISFGCLVVGAIPNTILDKFDQVILISPCFPGAILRSLFRFLQLMPHSIASNLLRMALFRWSELRIKEVKNLRAMRLALYDDCSLVAARLWKRVLSYRSAAQAGLGLSGISEHKIHLIFGASELALLHLRFARRRLLDQTLSNGRVRMHIVKGGHDITVRRHAGLLETISQIVIEVVSNA